MLNSQVVRQGVVSIKEDGLVSWLWRPKWLVLKEQTLSILKSEVRDQSLCFLSATFPAFFKAVNVHFNLGHQASHGDRVLEKCHYLHGAGRGVTAAIAYLAPATLYELEVGRGTLDYPIFY